MTRGTAISVHLLACSRAFERLIAHTAERLSVMACFLFCLSTGTWLDSGIAANTSPDHDDTVSRKKKKKTSRRTHKDKRRENPSKRHESHSGGGLSDGLLQPGPDSNFNQAQQHRSPSLPSRRPEDTARKKGTAIVRTKRAAI